MPLGGELPFGQINAGDHRVPISCRTMEQTMSRMLLALVLDQSMDIVVIASIDLVLVKQVEIS